MINIGDKTEGDYLCLLKVPWPSVTGWGEGRGKGISVLAMYFGKVFDFLEGLPYLCLRGVKVWRMSFFHEPRVKCKYKCLGWPSMILNTS